MWKMGRDGSGWVGNVFGNDFGLGKKLKSLFWTPNWIFLLVNLEILEHKSFVLTSEPGNTGTPVGSDTVAVFWYIGFFIFGKVTFWDLLDMFRFKKLHVCSFLLIFGNILSENSIFAAGTARPGRGGRAGAGRPGRDEAH